MGTTLHVTQERDVRGVDQLGPLGGMLLAP
jgi:hypothetical protein